MNANIVQLKCDGCGESLTLDMKECPTCGKALVISQFNEIAALDGVSLKRYMTHCERIVPGEKDDPAAINTSLGMCYLRLGQYPKAISAFDKAMDYDVYNSETYYYAAIAAMKGKRPFLLLREDINTVQAHLDSAVMLEPRGIYYYFLAFIKYDYFSRKFFKTSPTYQEALAMARQYGYSPADAQNLFRLLKVEKPPMF